jgi:enamine deaminase RidA (YjgF/YER057c/UK114 family)
MFNHLLNRFKRSLLVAFFVSGLVLTYFTLTPRSLAAEVVRHPIPNSTFPIALAVETPATATTVYVSGQVPPVVNADVDKNSVAAYGDTQTQTVNVLQRIQEILTSLDLTMSDVVKMQAFLVADPESGKMDFEGFMAGYTQFFGTPEQPNLPARSTMEVAALVNPGWLVEIEVVALRMP